MTNEIQQHPDGHHIVRVDDKVYIDTPQNLKKDFGTTLPDLPEDADERIYRQGIHHSILAKNSVIDGGPIPWPTGDSLFGKIDTALAKQKKRDDDDKDAKKKKVDDDIKAMEKEVKDKKDKLDADNQKEIEQLKFATDIKNAQLKANHEVIFAENQAKDKVEKERTEKDKEKAEKIEKEEKDKKDKAGL